MADVKITDNTDKFKDAMADAVARALEAVGIQAEGYAKLELDNAPRRIDTGNLRNSITHVVVDNDNAVYIGTNVEYAVYVHEGTGIFADGGRQTPWVYRDEDGKYHRTQGMKPNRFLKKAVEKNKNEYAAIINSEMHG